MVLKLNVAYCNMWFKGGCGWCAYGVYNGWYDYGVYNGWYDYGVYNGIIIMFVRWNIITTSNRHRW